MRFPRNNKIFRGQLDFAPFAAVFFCLLLITMVHQGAFVFSPGLPIRLPEAVGLSGTTNETLAVAVDSVGNVYFGNEVVTTKRLKTLLQTFVRQANGPLTLLLLADAEVKLDVLIELGMIARAAGIAESMLGTRERVAPRLASPHSPPAAAAGARDSSSVTP